MIELMQDLPDEVLGFSASGKVTGDDYEQVLIPAVEAKLKAHPKVRLLYHLGAAFEGFEAEALWDDAKVGMHHLNDWERIAVVTDTGWIRGAVKVFGFAMPGRIRTFADGELAQAKDWISES